MLLTEVIPPFLDPFHRFREGRCRMFACLFFHISKN
nr:MAG TPA: hypothetical protein [Caudoviricetes sp.]